MIKEKGSMIFFYYRAEIPYIIMLIHLRVNLVSSCQPMLPQWDCYIDILSIIDFFKSQFGNQKSKFFNFYILWF